MATPLSKRNIWADYTKRLNLVMCEALKRLRDKTNLSDLKEEPLNRTLYQCMQEANWTLGRSKGVQILPSYDPRNPPMYDQDSKLEAEDKRPDFSTQIYDYDAPENYASLSFCIECKRVGEGTGSWPLQENYVRNGVERFRNESHRYGQNANWGLMIGYIESLNFDENCRIINQHLDRVGLPHFKPYDPPCADQYLSGWEHSFERTFPQSPFVLRHLWVDLRDKIMVDVSVLSSGIANEPSETTHTPVATPVRSMAKKASSRKRKAKRVTKD